MRAEDHQTNTLFPDNKEKTPVPEIKEKPPVPENNEEVPVPENPKENDSGLHKDLKIDDFVLIDKLGTGGMGEVWKAKQLSMSRDVALKILSPELSRNEAFVKRFLNEAVMTGKLWHPNIITAYTAGNSGNYYYMATLYIDGIELNDKIRIDGMLPEREALKIVRAIASALCYAWEEHRLLHCDIKPSNIMVDRYRVPYLMDLGISKIFSEDESSPESNLLVGSIPYMSPEQIATNIKLDLRTDIYSLGVTLYQMVTANLPFRNESLEEAIANRNKKFPSPNERNPYLTEGCVALIAQMMAYDREDRQSDWNYVIADIDAVMAGTYFVGKNIKRAKWDSIKSKRKNFNINAPIHLGKEQKAEDEKELEKQPLESTQKIEKDIIAEVYSPPKDIKEPPPVIFDISKKKNTNLKFAIIAASIIIVLAAIGTALYFILR